MRYSNDMNFDAIGTIQRARAQQMSAMMGRSNFPYSNNVGGHQQPQRSQMPTYGGNYGNDTVTLGGNSWGYSSGDSTRLSNGQSIEELFNNPYAGTDMGYLQEALDKIQAARRMYGVQPPSKMEGQKGDLRVIAGDRADGVKPKEVRIDDANNYDYQKSENGYQDSRYETRFKDGTVGREYDVTVTWADGGTTKKRVKLKEPGQIVYMNSNYSF